MTVKLVLLKSGEDVVADVKEILSGTIEQEDSKVIGYVLNNSYRVKLLPSNENQDEFQISFFPWIPLTEQKSIPIPPDWVVTIVEPIDQVKKSYEEKINGQNNQDTSANEQFNSDNSD